MILTVPTKQILQTFFLGTAVFFNDYNRNKGGIQKSHLWGRRIRDAAKKNKTLWVREDDRSSHSSTARDLCNTV